MRLEAPFALLLLGLAPFFLEPELRQLILRRLGLGKLAANSSGIAFAHTQVLSGINRGWKARLRGQLLSALKLLSLALLVIAVARPQSSSSYSETLSSGRDIILTLDLSKSMHALDFELNGKQADRLSALKSVVQEFIERRKGDRMGLVVFADKAYTQCPLTLDHRLLSQLVAQLRVGMAGQSTAIGDGLAVALKRIKDIESKSKVVILVTDGANTSGRISPETAAATATELGITVYTIGIGKEGAAPIPVQSAFGTQLGTIYAEFDEKTLVSIAEATGGQYFHAEDTSELRKIYREIDKLEERKEKQIEYVQYQEQFLPFAISGLVIWLLYEVLAGTLLLRVGE